MKKVCLAFLVMAAWGTTTIASPKYDLLKVYGIATCEDQEIQIANELYNAKSQDAPIAFSKLLPQITGQATSVRNNQGATVAQEVAAGEFSGTNSVGSGYGVSLTQTLFNFSDYKGLEAARQTVEKAYTDYQIAEQDLILRVSARYLNVLLAGDELEFAQANYEYLKNLLNVTNKRYDNGLVSIADVEAIKASFDESNSLLILRKTELANAEFALREIINLDLSYNNLKKIKNPFNPMPVQPNNFDEWLCMIMENNLAIKSAEAAKGSARAKYESISLEHLPYVVMEANAQKVRIDNQPNKVATSSVSFTVQAPIFLGGSINSRSSQAFYEYQATKNQEELTKRQAERFTSEVFRNLQSLKAQLKSLAQAEKSTKIALKAIEKGYEAGSKSIIDVLLSESQVLNSKRNLAIAKYIYVRQYLNLYALVGSLNQDLVSEVNRQLF